jgi:hypothetical protein
MDRMLRVQVEAQPYVVEDWAGFTPLSVTALGVLVLAQAEAPDPWELESWQPLLTIAVSGSPSPQVQHRLAVARRAFEFVAFVTDIQAESIHLVQREAASWYEVIGQGRSLFDPEVEQAVFLFQALSFGKPGQSYVRVVGVAPAERRLMLLPQMRRLARSIVPKLGCSEWQPDLRRSHEASRGGQAP